MARGGNNMDSALINGSLNNGEQHVTKTFPIQLTGLI